MIVSKFAFCQERGVWAKTEINPPDVPLRDSEFHPLHPCFPPNARKHRGRWAHLFQAGQERE